MLGDIGHLLGTCTPCINGLAIEGISIYETHQRRSNIDDITVMHYVKCCQQKGDAFDKKNVKLKLEMGNEQEQGLKINLYGDETEVRYLKIYVRDYIYI